MFVRYREVKELERAIFLDHGRMLNGRRLRVLEAKKPNSLKEDREGVLKNAGRDVGIEGNGKSFKEALLSRKNKEEQGLVLGELRSGLGRRKSLEIILAKKELEWLGRSAIRELRSAISCSLVEHSLFRERVIAQVRLVGGLFVLVPFGEKIEMEELLHRCMDLFEPWFLSISPYCVGLDKRKYRVCESEEGSMMGNPDEVDGSRLSANVIINAIKQGQEKESNDGLNQSKRPRASGSSEKWGLIGLSPYQEFRLRNRSTAIGLKVKKHGRKGNLKDHCSTWRDSESEKDLLESSRQWIS
ncbi:Uncharacterized protein TCM_017251 [Theobroma cacao]|uniref:Uncharacterized protein n=1 Tax=Theobroma cacao TaxID=3641 RepID=A0A061EKL9_THECC|nr:Uncharacterized protein TCM_017251 [Theobroma cacao]